MVGIFPAATPADPADPPPVPGMPGILMPGMPPSIIMLLRSSMSFLLFWAIASWLYSLRRASCLEA